jgi:hypothetical protein
LEGFARLAARHVKSRKLELKGIAAAPTNLFRPDLSYAQQTAKISQIYYEGKFVGESWEFGLNLKMVVDYPYVN